MAVLARRAPEPGNFRIVELGGFRALLNLEAFKVAGREADRRPSL